MPASSRRPHHLTAVRRQSGEIAAPRCRGDRQPSGGGPQRQRHRHAATAGDDDGDHPRRRRPRRSRGPPTTTPPRLLPGVVVNREELCAMASITAAQLASLEEYGVIGRRKGATDLYTEDTVEIAAAAGGLLRAGIDARHLRAWRTSVEREVGLYEQLVMPLLRQRNPEARHQVVGPARRAQQSRGQAAHRPAACRGARAARLVRTARSRHRPKGYARTCGTSRGRRSAG